MELSQQGANKPCCGGSFLQFGKTAAQLMLRLMFLDSAVQIVTNTDRVVKTSKFFCRL